MTIRSQDVDPAQEEKNVLIPQKEGTTQRWSNLQKVALAVLLITSLLVFVSAAFWGTRLAATLARNASVPTPAANVPLGGFPLAGDPAPDFKLTDQFGQTVALSSLRGREIVLAFIDSRCKTICPFTATIMYNARMRLGAAAGQVVLVAINANPAATSVTEVQSWSIEHGMLHQWSFLTGSAQQLLAVYHDYKVYDQVDTNNAVTHDPIIYIIDAQGRERLSFETLNSNNQADLSDQEAGLEAGMRQWLPQTQK